MASIGYLFVVCDECNAEIDRVEYDAGAPSEAVAAVAASLGMSEEEAHKLVGKRNPGAELSSEERAQQLADLIGGATVEDREAATYRCPRGHDTGAHVQRDNPTPVVVTALERNV